MRDVLARDVQPPEHRFEPGARAGHADLDLPIPMALLQDGGQPADPLLARRGPLVDHEGPPPEDLGLHAAIARPPRVLQRALEVRLAGGGSPLPEPDMPTRLPPSARPRSSFHSWKRARYPSTSSSASSWTMSGSSSSRTKTPGNPAA